MPVRLLDDFVYIFLLYTAFSLLLQVGLMLAPPFILTRVNVFLPLLVGVNLGLAVLVMDALSMYWVSLKPAAAPLSVAVWGGLIIGDFMYCTLARACNFKGCKMPAYKLDEVARPCERHSWALSFYFWIVSGAVLTLTKRFAWPDLGTFTSVAWGLVLLQWVWGKLVPVILRKT